MFTLVLAIAVLGIARMLHADGALLVFVAGLAYNYTVADDEVGAQNTVDEAVNRYLVLPLFLLLGVELPWSDWPDLGWRAVLLPLAVLLLRRLPVLLLLARPLGLRLNDAVFLGWFGPVGVSALFYLTLSADEGVTDPRLWAAGTTGDRGQHRRSRHHGRAGTAPLPSSRKHLTSHQARLPERLRHGLAR